MKDTEVRLIRVRMAPSPTGFMHVGNARTVIYNWLFARKHGGTFLLRIEDTDQARLVPGSTENLFHTLQQLDLVPDEGVRMYDHQIIDQGPYAPYFQSSRREKYRAYADELVERGFAYPCFCPKERSVQLTEKQKRLKQSTMYDRHCRGLDRDEAKKCMASGKPYVIRLAVPLEGSITCQDMIRGDVTFAWEQIEDAVLMKSDGFPTYHLAAMCDDHDMQISHVIRGEEWISSLPKHVFLYQALGWEAPKFAHVPLILNPNRSKLSKRQGDVSVEDFLGKGYLPKALVNFLALLGWNPSADREIFEKEELAELFDIAKVNKSGAVFNIEKLRWLNAHYLKQETDEEYLMLCRPWLKDASSDEAFIDRVCLMTRDRLQVLSELPELTAFLFQDKLNQDPMIILWKKQTPADAKKRLRDLRAIIAEWPGEHFFAISRIENTLKTLIQECGWNNGETLWPLRVALSGMTQSPSPFELLYAYGKERALERIDEALERMR